MGSTPVEVPASIPIDPVGAMALLATGLLTSRSSAVLALISSETPL